MATVVQKTIKSTGGDYSSIAALSVVNRDCVGNNEIWIVDCYNFEDSLGVGILFNGWVTDEAHYLLIRAVDEHDSGGNITTSAYRIINTASSTAISFRSIGASGVVILDGLQMRQNVGGVGKTMLDCGTNANGANGTLRIKECIISSANKGIQVNAAAQTNKIQAMNSIIVCSGAGRGVDLVYGSNHALYNCTVIGRFDSAIYLANNPTNTIKNCYFGSFQNDAISTAVGVTKISCATSDLTGTAGLRSIPYNNNTFVSTGTNSDYRLSKNSPLIRRGSSISSQATPFNYNNDINERQRDLEKPSIGASEIELYSYPFNVLLGCRLDTVTYPSISGLLGVYTEGSPHTEGNSYLGSIIYGQALADHNRTEPVGVYVLSTAKVVPASQLGVYLNALPKVNVPEVYVGVLASGLFEPHESQIGCFLYGYPNNDIFCETHGRVLTKANSIDAVGQNLEIDAKIVLKDVSYDEYNNKIIICNTGFGEYNNKLTVKRNVSHPTVVITNVDYILASGEVVASGQPIPNFYNNARKIRVTASGTFGTASEWNHAYIDFGEPYRNNKATTYASISGFSSGPVWTAEHVYTGSGLYAIVARGQDINGCIGSDVSMLNLASGLLPGVDYTAISISGTPRYANAPPSVYVSFDVDASGVGSIAAPTDSRLFWNMGNRETSKRKAPHSYYSSPGEYVVSCRYLYRHSSGSNIWSSDTLKIGFNR